MASSGSRSEELAVAAAEAAKARGNARFKAKEYTEAIREYSEAIELQPENHVLYSNRSGAYLGEKSVSKALWDAEKCVELAPEWAKGYSRLGAAQHGLGRFEAAQASYLKGLELERNSQGTSVRVFEAGLEAAKVGEKKATEERIREEKRKEAQEEERKRRAIAEEAARREAERAETGETVDDFFKALGETVDEREKRKREKTNPVTEKYKLQDLGTGKALIERLTVKFSEFKNLNPYVVLDLDIDATLDDVKIRYRKLSALCHPDKNLDDQDRASKAFEAVKTAYQILIDPKQRDRTVLVIEGARQRAMRDHEALVAKGVVVDPPDLNKAVMKTFAENEMRRRDVEEHKRAWAARERQQEDELKQKEIDEKKFEDQWNQDDRRNARVDFWQSFQDDTNRAGNQKRIRSAKNFKQEDKVQKKPKHGSVDLESWRRDWK